MREWGATRRLGSQRCSARNSIFQTSSRLQSAGRETYDEPAGAAPLDADRAGGGDTLMQHHGPNGMGGPLRGTSVWWHGGTDQTQSPVPEELQSRTGNDRDAQENEPMIRRELVNRVRREIADGIYDTPKKWEDALDRLLDRLYRE
jgi:hypothetical protein